MKGFLFIFFSVCEILLCGNGFPYREFLNRYQNRDDYYEDYYLRRIPKLRTSPEKVKQFFINHLSWFPIDTLEAERKGGRSAFHSRRSNNYDILPLEPSVSVATAPTIPTISTVIPMSSSNTPGTINPINHNNNHTDNHNGTWTNLKEKSSQSMHKVKDYFKKKKFTEVLKNATHPFRYRGHEKNQSFYDCECIMHENNNERPSIHIHPKSSHVQVIKTSTILPPPELSSPVPIPEFPTHFSYPRKIKVLIDLTPSEKPSKLERDVNNDAFLANIEGDATNSTHVLETAGEMASDLAGRVSSLWHCVLGSHRIPETRDVKFYLYTRRNIIKPELLKVNYALIEQKLKAHPNQVDINCVDIPPEEIPSFERISDENRELIKSNYLNIKAPTKILIHGYTGSYKDSRMAKIKDAYLDSGRYNVILVDWEMLAAPPCYIRVTHHSKFVGETIAQFLDGLNLAGLNMSMVHLVGFSLGAQVAGFAGSNATMTPVCRITGLDPALPLFLHTQPSGRLDRFDAKFVDVIHTCGGILAMLDPLGHVDFYPNGGTRQPGCEFSNLKCSHSRAPQYFAESVGSQKKFTGQLCLNWEEYVTGDCSNTTNTSFMGEPCSRSSAIGKYYLLTKSKEPFVL